MMLPQLVGMARAKEIMFLGDWFSAQDAKEMGLVNQVYKQIDLMPEVMKIGKKEKIVLDYSRILVIPC